MAKTLADMTAEERQACVGMWCDNLVSTAKEPAPVVLACVQGETCWILHTGIHGERSGFPLESVAPRFDLPRAWTTEGEPTEWDWQYADYPPPGINRGFYSVDEATEKGTELPDSTTTTRARRLVGEWEQDQ